MSDPLVLTSFKSQMSLVIRSNWSNPPNHGARIVHMILTSPSMYAQWHNAIKVRYLLLIFVVTSMMDLTELEDALEDELLIG